MTDSSAPSLQQTPSTSDIPTDQNIHAAPSVNATPSNTNGLVILLSIFLFLTTASSAYLGYQLYAKQNNAVPNESKNVVNDKDSTTNNVADSFAEPELNNKIGVLTGQIGEPVKLSNSTVTITDVEYNFPTKEYEEPAPGKKYMVITVYITNTSNKSIRYDGYDFMSQDQTGDRQHAIYLSTISQELKYGELAPGGKKIGQLAFEVPEKSSMEIFYDNRDINQQIAFDLKSTAEPTVKISPESVQ